jgi:hypothetical protein
MLKIVNGRKGRTLFNTFVTDFLYLLIVLISEEQGMFYNKYFLGKIFLNM